MFSAFFIDRPKFAFVISLVMTIIGGIAYLALPVEQFPEITPPVVRVSTEFIGASAETLEETVAAPIEGQVNGVDDMLYMSSTSSDSGSYSLDVTFAVGTDPDQATVNVQNRVSQAMSQLPEEVKQSGVRTEKSSSNMLMLVTLFAPDGAYDEVFLSNFASINLKDPLARVPGVGRVDVMTDFSYGMRIWLEPDRLAALSMTPADFIAAINDQNAIVPAGQIGAPPAAADQQFQYTVKARDVWPTRRNSHRSSCAQANLARSFASETWPASSSGRRSTAFPGDSTANPPPCSRSTSRPARTRWPSRTA